MTIEQKCLYTDLKNNGFALTLKQWNQFKKKVESEFFYPEYDFMEVRLDLDENNEISIEGHCCCMKKRRRK